MLSYSFYEIDGRVKRYAEMLVREGAEVDVISIKKSGQGSFKRINGVNDYRIQDRIANEKRTLTTLQDS